MMIQISLLAGRAGLRRPAVEAGLVPIGRTISMLGFVALLLTFFPSCGRRAELLDSAQTAWDVNDFSLAADRYEEFLKSNPHHEQTAMARFRVANVYYYNLKSYEKAIQHYIHLIEDFPKSPDVVSSRLRLAECYVALTKRREAINEYESLLDAPGGEIDARRIRLNIADLYYDINDLGQALAEYEKVTKDSAYDELNERAWLRIASIRFLRDEFEEALSAFKVVAEGAQDHAVRRQARLGVADCYARTFQYDLAVGTLEKTEPDPTLPDYLKQRIASIKDEQRQRNFSLTQTTRP
ncbi:MAG: tetratricopeptide repeat protein [Acidobacteriota bacterium]